MTTQKDISRRQLLRSSALGFGTVALTHLLHSQGQAAETAAAPGASAASGLLPRAPHFQPRAKSVIMLMQNGGPSQMELFDPKPTLDRRTGEELPASVRGGQRITGMTSGQSKLLMVGGAAWNTWNRMFQSEIVKAQNPDGSWPPLAGKSAGGTLQKDPDPNGFIYRTNLCILMLEVYYRYMPTTK